MTKECKHIIDGGHTAEVAFHQNSLVTQATCAAWAGEFNYAVEELGLHGLPAIEVNRCYLVEAVALPTHIGDGPPHVRPLFLEPMIDGKFIKFNSNCGDVFAWRAPEDAAGEAAEAAEAAEASEAAGSDGAVPTASDVPQAFTHWT